MNIDFTMKSSLTSSDCGVSVLQEDLVNKRSSLIHWTVTGTEIEIEESSRDKGNAELSAAKKRSKSPQKTTTTTRYSLEENITVFCSPTQARTLKFYDGHHPKTKLLVELMDRVAGKGSSSGRAVDLAGAQSFNKVKED